MVGTMIELPRAAVCADQLAVEAEFFSFGTNDLTQTALESAEMMPPILCMPTRKRKSMK